MASGGQIESDKFSDETFDVLCSMCKHQGKNTEGVKFCTECDDYFCVTCANIHSNVPLCAYHQFLDKTQVKTGNSKTLQGAPAERCDKHSHKHIDKYCQNHDRVGCSTCMEVDHNLCKDTFYIHEYLKNSTHKLAGANFQTRLKTISKTITEQTRKYKKEKQKLLQRKSELLGDIRKFRKEINDQLDILEKSFIAEIESKTKIIEDKIEKSLKQLQVRKVKFTAASNKMTNMNQTDEFVFIKLGEEAVNVARESIENNEIKYKSIHFQPNQALITQLRTNQSFGMIDIDSLLQIKGKNSLCVKIESDGDTCNIVSACYMDDGTIILADSGNQSLKRLDSNTYTVTEYCQLPGDPWQVCTINNSQVAVTFGSVEVHLISLEKSMKIKEKITTDFQCCGLAYAKNNLYISDSYTSVYIYTLSGEKLRQFSKDQSGQTLFSNICSLAVSKDATRIYVADADNGLIVLDNNGQVVSRYNGAKLRGAYCCYLTETGNALVSGRYSKNVVQFTSNGDLMGEVVNEIHWYIQAVCCNQQMSTMYLSQDSEDNIDIYDI